jgi:hypothetical protein
LVASAAARRRDEVDSGQHGLVIVAGYLVQLELPRLGTQGIIVGEKRIFAPEIATRIGQWSLDASIAATRPRLAARSVWIVRHDRSRRWRQWIAARAAFARTLFALVLVVAGPRAATTLGHRSQS